MQNKPYSDAQGRSVSMGATLAHRDEQSNTDTTQRRASVDSSNSRVPPVLMRVSDAGCEAGIRRFGHYPIMRGDELPGADMDRSTLQQNNVVYLLTDSLEGTNDSGVDSPGESGESKPKDEQPNQGSFVAM